jgi:hypothetical protein
MVTIYKVAVVMVLLSNVCMLQQDPSNNFINKRASAVQNKGVVSVACRTGT